MILRALAASAGPRQLVLELREVWERPWCSATFTGVRLTLALGVSGADPGAWLAALPDEDLPVPGRLVADVVVVAADGIGATLEVLLLEA